ncbi:hypothetical protein HJG60_011664 [Phyllostomus discolor]|uniref:Uncharacterized protein n=1 Tax=Phyllostomus discolor TaxID=89673 RepID=A0A833ZP09_9CHIR|nr:hypothetical protein HJG60_011664 [Phyllostomus discolor]
MSRLAVGAGYGGAQAKPSGCLGRASPQDGVAFQHGVWVWRARVPGVGIPRGREQALPVQLSTSTKTGQAPFLQHPSSQSAPRASSDSWAGRHEYAPPPDRGLARPHSRAACGLGNTAGAVFRKQGLLRQFTYLLGETVPPTPQGRQQLTYRSVGSRLWSHEPNRARLWRPLQGEPIKTGPVRAVYLRLRNCELKIKHHALYTGQRCDSRRGLPRAPLLGGGCTVVPASAPQVRNQRGHSRPESGRETHPDASGVVLGALPSHPNRPPVPTATSSLVCRQLLPPLPPALLMSEVHLQGGPFHLGQFLSLLSKQTVLLPEQNK